jgi:hypothetical protein
MEASSPARDRSPADILDLREGLGALWGEMTRLPVRQRNALLLHLDEIALIEMVGVAGRSTIAAVLEIPEGEFTALWDQLPLTDRQIADRLNATPLQVIGLRRSARERLKRHVKDDFCYSSRVEA